jgi:uncharacterized protein YjbI with pentapeptide repeats
MGRSGKKKRSTLTDTREILFSEASTRIFAESRSRPTIGETLEILRQAQKEAENTFLRSSDPVEVDLSRREVRNIDFALLNLDGTDFSESKLHGCFFEHSDPNLTTSLRQVDLSEASFQGCHFLNTNLTGAKIAETFFGESAFSQANFQATSLGGSRFSECLFDQVDFTEANLENLDWQSCSIVQPRLATGVSFQGSELPKTLWRETEFRDAVFYNIDMSVSVLKDCQLQGETDLEECYLNETVLSGSQLEEGVRVHDCQLKKLVFTEKSELHGVVFRDNFMQETGYLDSSLEEVLFENNSMENSKFASSRLENVRFFNCNLTGADFSTADLQNVSFQKCNLQGITLPDDLGPMDIHMIDCRHTPVAPIKK